MRKIVEDFISKYNEYVNITSGNVLTLNRDEVVKYLFSVDELMNKYLPTRYDDCAFLSKKEYNVDGDHFMFAENRSSNFVYVATEGYSEIFCTEFDGTFLWYCADSSDLFVSLLTVFISMQTKRILSGNTDLSDDEYFSYYLKCKVISGDFEDNDEFLKFMCCVIE